MMVREMNQFNKIYKRKSKFRRERKKENGSFKIDCDRGQEAEGVII